MKQPEVSQNIIGKRELAEFNALIDKICTGKIKYNAVEADEFKKANKIGIYREWEIDIKRIEEIDNMVKTGEAHMHPDMYEYQVNKKAKGGKKVGSGLGTGKKQLEAERLKLIEEINNI